MALRSADMTESDERLRRIYIAKQEADAAYLVGALTDDEHRVVAAKFLADLEATESAPALERLLNANDPAARRAAARALGAARGRVRAPSSWTVAASDPDPVARAWAVAAIAAVGGDGARLTICGYLADSDSIVRRGAAYALGVLGDPEALPPLKAAKKAERWSRRRVYREAARRIRLGTAVDIGPGQSNNQTVRAFDRARDSRRGLALTPVKRKASGLPQCSRRHSERMLWLTSPSGVLGIAPGSPASWEIRKFKH